MWWRGGPGLKHHIDHWFEERVGDTHSDHDFNGHGVMRFDHWFEERVGNSNSDFNGHGDEV